MIAQRSWIQKKKNLIATMKLKPAFDNSLEAKAVKFLESMCMGGQESADAFLSNFGQTSDASLTDFIQSIVVLVSSSNQVITTAAMEMLVTMIVHCSAKVRLSIIKADLIPQLILTLNPLSLSFTEAVDIRIPLLNIISVLSGSQLHSSKYVLIINPPWINLMVDQQWEWNRKSEEGTDVADCAAIVEKEGHEDTIEEMLQKDRNSNHGRCTVAESVEWTNQLGMNVPPCW
ncbi:hypothetical protein BLNAU_25263 [Blattamonas nauphoetae]|uniref:Uncharacterized protein n=1 Tax=Blattamonas nauphoetae TaxID=2049346 RepID=A0ABQ9WK34_9EUKA|nr:hypothetical protein BLNAU_25263 [Blattamonas nauphoetae]